MNIEAIASYGNAIGGIVIVICLIVFLIISKQLGTDERSDTIFLKVYKLMFTVLSVLILVSIFFNVGSDVSGATYQNLTALMFAICFVMGLVYLIALKRRY